MERIAIIGTGISAMGAAYFLKDRYDITFYEKEDYPGGHTNTLTVNEDGRDIYIDSGFMVYNKKTYPNVIRLFEELQIEEIETTMSFSVQHIPSGLEWSGNGLGGLFAQRKNLFSLKFWSLLKAMVRFNHQASEVLDDSKYSGYSVGEYVSEKGFGEDFLQKYLMPMCAAIWSTIPEKVLDFPIVTLVRFFKNHGFLGFLTHFQWYTLKGGSRTYRDKIMAHFKGKVHLNTPVMKVSRNNDNVDVIDAKGRTDTFDKVIIACHSDQALKLLEKPTDLEHELLGKIKYQKNKATLHTDEKVMPKLKRAWSSWNYRIDHDGKGRICPGNIYYMNLLQKVSQKKNYFISIDDRGLIDPSTIIKEIDYEHPLFDIDAVNAQAELPRLNENGLVYFCGAYFKYGFHEDGLTSGMNVARAITGETIWN
jgi:predicted NAD/FAD-binding protein